MWKWSSLSVCARVRALELFDQGQQLARREPELGLVATGVLPFAGTEAFQAHAHAEPGLDAKLRRFLDHEAKLGRFFDDDEYLKTELAPDQGQADVLAILVAVADDHAAASRQRDHGHQFRLGARFQPEARRGIRGQFTGHVALLVDLDRIDRGVAAVVVPIGHGLGKRTLQTRAGDQ
jgi:hypothetical protein